MNDRTLLSLVAPLLLALAPGAARAEALSGREAVAQALARNPAHAAAAAQLAQAGASLRSSEARLDPTLSVSAGANRLNTPTASLGTTLLQSSLQFSADAALKKKLIGGAEFTFSLGSTWQRSQTPFAGGGAGTASAITSSIATIGPNYGLTARIAVTQPLLRGAGRDVGLAAEREARVSQTSASASRDRSASELTRDVLTAYYELWYASAAVAIQQSARDTSQRQRDEAKARRDTGSLADADLFSFETELGQAEESLLSARIDERTRASELARLLGRERADELRASDEPPAPAALEGDLEAEVLEASPEVAERRAEVELAGVRARTAEDAYRPRLDLDAYAQAQGLGNRDAAAAVGQVAGLDAVSLHVGLTYELPLQDRRQKAEAERASQAVIVARSSLASTRQRLLSQAAAQRDKASGARRRLDLAASTAAVARASFAAEQERFRTGSSTALAVSRAQDQARSAELRLARARVDLASAHAALLHLTGRLLRQGL